MKTNKKSLKSAMMILAGAALFFGAAASAFCAETYKFERMWPTLQQPWYFPEPVNVTIDAKGYVYVINRRSNQIHKFTSNGQFVSVIGGKGTENGKFNNPQHIAFDSDGNFYVTDTSNYRIQKLDPDGRFITAWGKQGTGDGEFSSPVGIAVDSKNFIYVTDHHPETPRIQKFTANGQFVIKWGSKGSGNGEFNQIENIAIDKNDYVYTIDSINNNIQKFTAIGNFEKSWVTDIANPISITIDKSGFIVVPGNNYVMI